MAYTSGRTREKAFTRRPVCSFSFLISLLSLFFLFSDHARSWIVRFTFRIRVVGLVVRARPFEASTCDILVPKDCACWTTFAVTFMTLASFITAARHIHILVTECMH